MGNNAAFTSFEATVIAVYNRGVLDKDLLSDLMEPYRDVDIDSGGMQGTLSKDGFDCVEIVCKVFGLEIPPRPQLPPDYRTWSEEQSAQNESWYETYWSAFYKITEGFGWS